MRSAISISTSAPLRAPRHVWRRLLVSLLILLAAVVVHEVRGETETATDSVLTGARLPEHALRLRGDSVPGEVHEALGHLIAAGGADFVGGETETLAWTTPHFRTTAVPAMMRTLRRELASAGWTYEPIGEDGELTLFSLYRTTPVRRGVIGFYTSSDAALVLAWTEILNAGAARPGPAQGADAADELGDVIGGCPPPAGVREVIVDATATHVNVMGRDQPGLPAFPPLAAQPGTVRGYVFDVHGRPLEGAAIGVRVTAVGGFYSGAQGETDADGYYEFPVPAGMAHFYNAGHAVDWGDGRAAVTLHPADGKLGTFATAKGVVENFVLLPYGITSRDNLSENPHLPSTYYGGALYLGYWTRAVDDAWAPQTNLVEGSVIELTLTPDGASLTGDELPGFVIRKPASGSGFRLNNLPLGRYRLRATLADGRPLKVRLNRPRNSPFGLFPAETTGEAVVVFAPDSAKAAMVTPQYGSWNAVELSLELP